MVRALQSGPSKSRQREMPGFWTNFGSPEADTLSTLNTPSLRHFEMFQCLMRTRSLTATARSMGLSQPAISLALKEMESQVGFRLFDRNSRRVNPTAQANALEPEIERLVRHVEALSNKMFALRESTRTTIRIATVFSLSVSALPDAVARFSPEHADVRLVLDVHTRQEVHSLVSQGRADIGFLYTSGAEPDVVTEQLMTTRLVCVMPEGHDLAAKPCIGVGDLADHPVIIPNAQTVPGLLVAQRLERARGGLGQIIEVNNAIAAINLVRGGTGIALCDPLLLCSVEANQVVGRPFDPPIDLTMSMISPNRQPISPMTLGFIAAVHTAVKRTAAQLLRADIPTEILAGR
jgi:DNA-binding transcriptional LysR family regulator